MFIGINISSHSSLDFIALSERTFPYFLVSPATPTDLQGANGKCLPDFVIKPAFFKLFDKY
jgi:hypothetical protein